MNLKHRPQELSKIALIKMRRRGIYQNYNFQNRVRWYPAGWGFNKRVLGNIHTRLHYLACHAPEPVQKRWSKTYSVFVNKHFGDAGPENILRYRMRYLNKWSCHSWL